jgi:hypothetical protein
LQLLHAHDLDSGGDLGQARVRFQGGFECRQRLVFLASSQQRESAADQRRRIVRRGGRRPLERLERLIGAASH